MDVGGEEDVVVDAVAVVFLRGLCAGGPIAVDDKLWVER